MITNKEELNKKKVSLMQSIMRDPKLSKVLRESLSAPMGSTKREYAQSIISIMKKVGGLRFDGQGGVGSGAAGIMQQAPTPRVFIFPAAPRFRHQDGQGGPLNDMSKLTVSGGVYSTPPSLIPPKGLNLSGMSINDTNVGMTRSPASIPPGSEKLTYSQGVAFPTTGSPKIDMSGTDIRRFEPGYNILAELQRSGQLPGASTPQVATTEPTGASTTAITPVGVPQYQTPAGPITQPPVTPDQPKEERTPGGSPYAGVTEAVRRGVGPATFALGTMGTPGGAERILGLPAGTVPTGTLTQQINSINEALRKENQIDTLQNQLINMKSRGLTVDQDLTNYIKGRDEYIGHLDQLIDTANDSMKDMDLTAPGVAQSMDSYTKFLYTLKGRQNQRYLDYVKQSRNEFDRDYELLQNKYNTAFQRYQDALQLKTGITKEEYGMIYNALSDLYTSLESAPKKALEMQKLEAELVKIYSDAAKSTGHMDTDFWKDIKEYKDFYVDDKGKMLPNVNITNAISQVAGTGKDPAGAVQLFTGAMVRDIHDKIESGVLTDAIKAARQYIDQVSELAQSGGGTAAIGMGNTIASTASHAVKQYITENESAVKAVLKDLVDSLKSKRLPTRDKFIADNKDVLDAEILGDIYDYARVNLAPNPNIDPNLLFTTSGKVSSAPPEAIGSRLGIGIGELWKAQINNASVRSGSFNEVGNTTASKNIPQRNQNPGNIKKGGVGDQFAKKDAMGNPMTDDQGHLIFFSSEDGMKALEADIKAKIEGKSSTGLPKNPTVSQLGKVYAEDPNWPVSVARILGVTTDTAIGTIPLKRLVAAIAQQEGFNA